MQGQTQVRAPDTGEGRWYLRTGDVTLTIPKVGYYGNMEGLITSYEALVMAIHVKGTIIYIVTIASVTFIVSVLLYHLISL